MSTGDEFSAVDSEAFPTLPREQFKALADRSEPQDVAMGDILFTAGDESYDFILIESGEVEIVRVATVAEPEEQVVARHGAGRFLGELNMLTGQRTYLTGRV